MAEKRVKEERCACGVELPHHLAEVGLTEHVCSCERHYVITRGKFELVGFEHNPFCHGVDTSS